VIILQQQLIVLKLLNTFYVCSVRIEGLDCLKFRNYYNEPTHTHMDIVCRVSLHPFTTNIEFLRRFLYAELSNMKIFLCSRYQ